MTQRRWLAKKCYICDKVVEEENALIIDEDQDLIFCSEEHLYQHFADPIKYLEEELDSNRAKEDIPKHEFQNYEECLDQLLDSPEEIWEDSETFKDLVVNNYIGEFSVNDNTVYYVAITYQPGEQPSFVFMHFPTTNLKLVEHFRRGRLVYDSSQNEIEIEATEEDALTEGDELAVGLFDAMLALRSTKDIPETEFQNYLSYRSEAIEEADEIWKHDDLQGNTLVTFIKEFNELNELADFFYVVVTIEDVVSGSHYIMFSFPTNDAQLLDRYRQGQNLKTENAQKPESH